MVENQDFNQWAVIEVFGHQKFAGHVTTQQVGSASYLRIDVPESEGDNPLPAFQKLINHSSVFSITPVAEEYARGMAARLRSHPVQGYEHQQIVTSLAEKALEDMKMSEVKRLMSQMKGRTSSREMIAEDTEDEFPY